MSSANSVQTLFAAAVDHHLRGRVADALALYDAVIRSNPNMAAAHCNRGLLLQSLGRTDEALASYDRAIRLEPRYADAHFNRAIALRHLGRPGDAVKSYDRAIAARPDHSEAHCNRANALRDLARPEEALQGYDRSIRLNPRFAEAHYGRGNALQDLGRLDEALASFDRAIALRPDFAEALGNRGNVLRMLGRAREALQSCDRALALKPRAAEAHTGKANALKDLMRLPEALQSYDRAIALEPDDADAHWNKALCLLLMGRFEEGWPLYEWRKKKFEPQDPQSHSLPVWSGAEDLQGRSLLIRAEQGLGDTIQFCRYAPLAQAKGASVTLAVQKPLTRLLATLDPAIAVIGTDAKSGDFDYRIALLSMPLACRTDVGSCPSTVPYLHAEPDRVARWSERLGSEGFRIGICWQGNKASDADAGRSIPLRCFAGLAGIPGVRLISLQKNDGIEQLNDLPSGLTVEVPGEDFDAGPDAFVDTAAVMENLDLVVTCDTAVAHLAAALGRPTWVALKHVPDWRWLLDRSDSPWYPTVTLFRQKQPGDWSAVFAAMEAALADRVRPR